MRVQVLMHKLLSSASLSFLILLFVFVNGSLNFYILMALLISQ